MRHPSDEDLAALALGALDRRRQRRVSKHADRCEHCRAALERLAPAIAVLGESVEQHEPPPALRERLMAEVRAETSAGAVPAQRPRPERRGPAAFMLRPAAGLAAVALAGAGIAGYLLAERGGEPTSTIPGSSELAGAEASLELDDDTATLEVSGMPALAKGAVYQAWVATETGSVRRSATFVPDADGAATAAVPEVLEGGTEVMVTEEPEPGREEPTLPPLLRVRVD